MADKFYITTSIPYANAGPHVGHILDPLIADVLARYHRQKGDEVRLLVGTDEHGIKIVRTAEAAGQSPQELVDENSAKFLAMQKLLDISYDDFIRTTDKKRHWLGAQKMWRELVARGDIYKKTYRGLYCVGHEAFITEKDLIDGKCQDHQKEPEVIEEENWFFRLSKYSTAIKEKIESSEFLILPESRRNEILSLIAVGLEDVSFSRPSKSLSWGVPVPDDESQTMYVWCDALVNYISAIGYGHGDEVSKKLLEKWWPADLQVVGKDNLRFHAAIWPGMLLSTGIALPKMLFVHGFVNVDGQKISKTVGNVIPPEDIVSKYSTDPVRYYFLREFPPYDDGDFSYQKFEDRYNGELANGLGNLVSRVTTLGEKLSPLPFKYDEKLEEFISKIKQAYPENIEKIRLNEALANVWEIISRADKFINENEPWKMEDEAKKKEILGTAAYLIYIISDLIFPFMPVTSAKIKEQIILGDSQFEIKKAGNLFPRI